MTKALALALCAKVPTSRVNKGAPAHDGTWRAKVPQARVNKGAQTHDWTGSAMVKIHLGYLTRSITTDAYLRCFRMIWELGLDFALIWDSVLTSFGA